MRCSNQRACRRTGARQSRTSQSLSKIAHTSSANEAAATGAKIVATACPFCTTMIRDGVNETGRSEDLAVFDVAELVARSLETSKS